MTIRRSLRGALVGGGVFGAGAAYRSLASGGTLDRFLGPTVFMIVLGATVGALAGPLVGQAIVGWKSERPEGGAVENDQSTKKVRGGRQPLWIMLLTGLGVGWAVGTAWEMVWVGVGVGLVLAVSARFVFR